MRVGFGSIHRTPSPLMATMVRRGMGQSPINLQDAMNSWFQSLSAESGADAAVGCGSGGGAPCTSPTEAAQMVYAYAASICQEAGGATSVPGVTLDPNCADGGLAVATAMYPKVLAFFNNLPASVWTEETANLSSGQYYGPGASSVPYNTPSPQEPGGSAAYQAAQSGNPVPYVPYSYSTVPASAPATPSSPSTGSGSPAPSSNTSNSTSSSSSGTTATADPLAWLTDTSIDSIPNWVLLVGGLAVLMILPSLLGGRR